MKREERHPKYNEFLIACCASPSKAEYLLRTHPELLEAANGIGETPLHYLAIENRCEAVDFLIKHGAQVNTRDYSQTTPLMSAAGLGHREMVAQLLSAEADPNVCNDLGETLLGRAVSHKANSDVVKMLLDHSAQIDIRDDCQKRTPLIEAVKLGRADIVRLLLERGADPNARDGWEETVLYIAASSEECGVDVIGLLLDAGADPLAPIESGEIPYYAALRMGRTAVADALAGATTEDRASGERP